MYIIDSHCHIQFNAYKNNFDEVISRCVEKKIAMNTVGTQKDTSKKAVEFAEKYENIYATIGLHPIHLFPTHIDEGESSFLSREEDFDESYYGQLAKSEKVIAVGECGIDLYHLPKDISIEKVLEKQREIFLKQVSFANKYNLPLVIHVRDAHKELLEILQSEIKNQKSGNFCGVVHCYTSNWLNAQRYLDMGLYLGFTGVITFPAKKTDPKPQEELLGVVKNCPLDRILVETDAPYLAPQVYRGQRCEPWMVEDVINKIAEIRNIDTEVVRHRTIENTRRLFTKIKIQ